MVSIGVSLTAACQDEALVAAPLEIIAIASQFGMIEDVKKMIGRGVSYKMLTDIPYSGIEFFQEAIDIGEEIRHLSGYRGCIFAHFIGKRAYTE
ncbi:MAG: hypothetical protein ACXVIF_08155 [Halobacteriota archaeon]